MAALSSSTLLALAPSKSNPNKSYEIRKGADAVVYCSCPDWKFQRLAPANRSCKHLKSFHAGQLAKKEGVETKHEAGQNLALAAKRKEAAKWARVAHNAMVSGGEVAVAAASVVLTDPMSAKTMKKLAAEVLAAAE